MSSDTELARFDLVERLVHWSTAIMMLTLIVTGAILYLPSLALRVGHRGLVENIHVITGLCLLGPLLLGVAGPWRKQLIKDLRRFDRWELPTSTGSGAPPAARGFLGTSSTEARRSRPPSSGR